MISKRRNDLFYVCALIEYTARMTKNKRGVIVNAIGKKGIKKLLKDASVNHCLTFEQVSAEVIEKYNISVGEFDTITNCKYTIPGYIDIGKLYTYIIEEMQEAEKDDSDKILSIFCSPISDEISNFKTGVYYENPSYLLESYKEGKLLDK